MCLCNARYAKEAKHLQILHAMQHPQLSSKAATANVEPAPTVGIDAATGSSNVTAAGGSSNVTAAGGSSSAVMKTAAGPQDTTAADVEIVHKAGEGKSALKPVKPSQPSPPAAALTGKRRVTSTPPALIPVGEMSLSGEPIAATSSQASAIKTPDSSSVQAAATNQQEAVCAATNQKVVCAATNQQEAVCAAANQETAPSVQKVSTLLLGAHAADQGTDGGFESVEMPSFPASTEATAREEIKINL